ncbi:NAD-dependent deacetylase [Brevibacterium sp. 5221]|uniref:protein acetyllysine N-acetyltransferase n=1 Tax=Brevibacterium rongguiense TaxID=2695267 RepID=A0A6N9H5A9_9MICO|nr:Sir2 family NAD-dependent protein deacetylase [Brevibacterium rongguiense]MYM19220.1 NAD-dependent deacetylase [Brevibacterium rongguiense]
MAVIKDPLRGLARPAPTASDAQIAAALAARPTGDWAVLTGAGMSTDSGIPDYRGPGAPPRSPMTGQTFRSGQAARSRYWARSFLGWPRIRAAQPNAAHRALARLSPHGTITQNVDGLHETAGSDPVIDLHGRLDRVICLQCGELFSRDWLQGELDALNPGFRAGLSISPEEIETAPDGDVALEETAGFAVPPCPVCGGILKPDVVFFGESVPAERAEAATCLAAGAHGLVVLGSSLAVLSGLRFVRSAAREGRPVVIVTDGPTRGDALAAHRSTSRVADFLAAWEAAVAP